ncbi:MAG: penicillin-insensitive murein endopeptidase [Xanthobacteraceae bacterium]
MMLAPFRFLHSMAIVAAVSAAAIAGTSSARAQANADPTPQGTLNPVPLPPLENPNAPGTPAKELFARKTEPLAGPARSIGGYADGCLSGGVALPITGPNWQVMRLSRNRNWGNPALIAFLERFAAHAKQEWNGLLVGDMSQPRGGPMISGHASHQIGLDADIWFTPMPDHVQTREEREMNGAVNMVQTDGLGVDHKVWTPERTALIRTATMDPATTRIFVNAAIKKEMCSEAGSDRAWLSKVRPWWGHAEHFHVRIACPADSTECKPQTPPDSSDGCGHELDFWFKESTLHPAPQPVPPKPRPAMTLAGLPPACKQVVNAP